MDGNDDCHDDERKRPPDGGAADDPSSETRPITDVETRSSRRRGGTGRLDDDDDAGGAMMRYHPDLPFLITHWLSSFAVGGTTPSTAGGNGMETTSEEERGALTSIHRAARDLAFAFRTLGAYGPTGHGTMMTTTNPTGSGRVNEASYHRPATYADLMRKYAPLVTAAGSGLGLGGGSGVLDAVVLSASSSSKIALSSASRDSRGHGAMPWSLLEAAHEDSVPVEEIGGGDERNVVPNAAMSDPSNEGGKMSNNGKKKKTAAWTGPGRKVGGGQLPEDGGNNDPADRPMRSSDDVLPGTLMLVGSGAAHDGDSGSRDDSASVHAAQTSRRLSSLRIEAGDLWRSMELSVLARQKSIDTLVALGPVDLPLDHPSGNDDESNNLRRVVVQLERSTLVLHSKYSDAKTGVMEAEREARKAYRELTSIRGRYRARPKFDDDVCPSLRQILRVESDRSNIGFGAWAHAPGRNNMAMPAIFARQYRGRQQTSSTNRTRLSVLKSRLSHAVTISSHLVYPVYCLKFDKTGKYFITGADDQVAKVFRFGVGKKSCGVGPSSINYGTNVRGAVLVCSLRGHAGVVADIDVSSDNSFLATASGDGDIRVWGLKDGWPVAILRGHTGGANMVSWSMRNPFQLVSCGEDGLARMWDVRKAALQRYGDHYSSSAQIVDAAHRDNITDVHHSTQESVQAMQPTVSVLLSQEVRREAAEEVSGIMNNNIPGIEFGRNFGDFVANDLIDAGVTLMAKLHHGGNIEDKGLPGPVTRTGHGKQVKVMCLTRSPVGGHFATGSDDGIGRVWADDDDWQMGTLDDSRQCGPNNDATTHSCNMTLKSSSAPAKGSLLATLRDVHTNAVTDMKYSSAGDRILTASMKDGNVCVWSGFHPPPLPVRFTITSQLCIQLREFSHDGSNAKVNCDGVAWTCDDTKVITSQSSPMKGSGMGIIPGSQFIYVWDSHTGKCLMGITSSHNSLCPSLAPHPHLPSVFASAGADGTVNVWDLDRGDCFYTYSNTLLHGPIESASDRGKPCGYLEAQFSPDGLNLVLTDESGRVIILDSRMPPSLQSRSDNVEEKALQEQYFANDYYELMYDANGYCIERGSGRPPHLAPGGVRCTHEGVPYTEAMRDTYRELTGPHPISPCGTMLDGYDARCFNNHLERGVISRNSHIKARRILARNPYFTQRCETAIIDKEGNFVHHSVEKVSISTQRVTGSSVNRNTNHSASNDRPLSNRYRWISFNDVPESEGEEEDQDDEEFVVNGRRLNESSEDERNEFLSQFHRRQESGRGRAGSGRRRRRERPEPDDEFREDYQPARASSRQAAQRTYNELNSDDEALEEFMSTHTKPSGEYVDDWNVSGHLFKLPRGGGSLVSRNWLCRTIQHGQKMYCPQVGDSVVYIPKAHSETLRKFPIHGYLPPWKSWPTASSWPVVRCRVLHARYRFPYEMYYKARSPDDKLLGVSAILTLEISGVPSKSSTRTYPWPAPIFVPPPALRTRSTDSINFEVTLFECDEEDFLIPERLYSWRVKQLERAIRANDGRVDGLSVSVLFKPESDTSNERPDDPDYLEFTGRLTRMNEILDDEEYHLFDSGYNALTMVWDSLDDATPYIFSVWSINMANPSCDAPVSPTMGEDVCLAVRGALHTTMNLHPNVNEWFFDHVDTAKFTDYLEMIEVPMYLSLIQKRLRGNYYTNKLSVIADMELLKENCYKYNEEGNDIFDLACQVYDEFRNLVDAIEINNTIGSEESATDPENDEQPIERDVPRAKSRTRAQTGSIEESEISDVEDRCQPPQQGIDPEHQVVSSRPNRRSVAQNSQFTAAGSPGQRTSSRARRKPTYMDEEHSESSSSDDSDESDSDVSAVEDASKMKRRPLPRTRSKPVYAEKDSDEEERASGFKNKHQVVSRRPNRRLATQNSQLIAAGSQRASSRVRKNPTYMDLEHSESEDRDESDGSGDGVSEGSDEEEQVSNFEHRVFSSRLTRRSAAQQSQLTEASGHCRRSSPRAKRKPNYEFEDSESRSGGERDGSDESVSAVEDSSQRKRRPSPRARSKPVYTEKDSDEEEKISDIENEYQEVSRRPNRRLATQNSQLTASCSPGQRTSFRNNRLKTNCEEDHVVERELSESSVGEESDGEDNVKRRLPPRARSKPVYTEIESDEGEFSSRKDESDGSDDEVSRPVDRKKRKGGRRRAAAPARKRVRTLHQKKSQYPELEKWQPVSKRLIQKVGVAVLEKLREMDHLCLFLQPVCEVFPAITTEYLRVVKQPMDFRTIEEERLHRYDDISELQDDVILTFRNCCVYNGEISSQKKYCKYALDLWRKLNDVYSEVTKKRY